MFTTHHLHLPPSSFCLRWSGVQSHSKAVSQFLQCKVHIWIILWAFPFTNRTGFVFSLFPETLQAAWTEAVVAAQRHRISESLWTHMAAQVTFHKSNFLSHLLLKLVLSRTHQVSVSSLYCFKYSSCVFSSRELTPCNDVSALFNNIKIYVISFHLCHRVELLPW